MCGVLKFLKYHLYKYIYIYTCTCISCISYIYPSFCWFLVFHVSMLKSCLSTSKIWVSQTQFGQIALIIQGLGNKNGHIGPRNSAHRTCPNGFMEPKYKKRFVSVIGSTSCEYFGATVNTLGQQQQACLEKTSRTNHSNRLPTPGLGSVV